MAGYTGYTDSHLVPFLERPSTTVEREYKLAEAFQSIDPLGDASLDHCSSNPDDPSWRTVPGASHQRPSPKVPIPRTSTTVSWTKGARVSQACKGCREVKTKCSGHRPACHRCEEIGIACHYDDRKRVKIDKQLNNLNAQIDMLENLLRDLYPRLDTQSAQHVDFSLGKILNHPAPLTGPGPPETYNTPEAPLATVDYTEEDFNLHGEIQALGFVGEHSERAWLYRLKCALEESSATPSTSQEGFIRLPFASINYYKTDWEMAVGDEVKLLERPSQSIADELVSTYFQIIHPSFPIIGRTTFVAQYRSYYSDLTARPGKQWLAVLNFIFATAAMHLSPVNNLTESSGYSHLVYFSRAWILSIENASLRDHPSLQQVQVEGLASFYLLASGQVNRSWKCCGIAIRSALIMGLNLRSESRSVAPLSKEIRYRMWWSLYMLDTSLSVITGRPPGISGIFCTTPLPIPFEEGNLQSGHALKYVKDKEARSCLMATLLSNRGGNKWKDGQTERVRLGYSASNKRSLKETTALVVVEPPQPSESLCLFYAASLTILIREAIDSLYAPGAAHKPWVEIEVAVSLLNGKADNWLGSLPAAYNLKTLREAGPLRRQCTSLAFHFYSAKLFITQPCLRRLLYRSPEALDLPIEASGSMTGICIQAAGEILALLPEEPDLKWLYGICPWWYALHYIMQSVTIILTQSFIRTRLGTMRTIGILPNLRKARAWLKEMSRIDTSAWKAWLVCLDFISRHGSRLGLGDDDSL